MHLEEYSKLLQLATNQFPLEQEKALTRGARKWLRPLKKGLLIVALSISAS